MEILVLTKKKTNRLFYALDLILHGQLGLDVRMTTDVEDFYSFDGPKFCYGDKKVGDAPFQKCVSILFEHTITTQDIRICDDGELKAFFPIYSAESLFPFDIFAATFYLVSRYEEYLPCRRDKHDRFLAENSILHKMDMMRKPLVNIWSIRLGEKLKSLFPSIELKNKRFTFIPTYDVDAAWSYKHKGFYRTTGAFLRDILHRDFDEVRARWRVLTNRLPDPFDTFDHQLRLQKDFKFKAKYFILCGEYALNDKNISIKNNAFRTLIKRLGDYALVGIHPSYSSYLDKTKVGNEIFNLSKVLNREITISRQHFLRMNLPKTYQILADLDIKSDYSMGYAEQPGFRAGTADPFNFFDLENDAPTKLIVNPFVVMDGTLRDYLNLDTDGSLKITKSLIDEVRAVNGTFVLIWHNETLSNQKRWTGWKKLHGDILEYAFSK